MGSINNDVNVDRVAVVGAGSAGLAAAKYLIAEDAFSEIVVFEQGLNVGGVWNATLDETADASFIIPQTKPSQIPKVPAWRKGKDQSGGDFQFISPIYDALETNIPQTLMNYSDLAFPEGTSLFPRYDVVLEYLERYADDIRHFIKFGTQVLNVRSVRENDRDKWRVETRDIRTSAEITSVFDAVIVANGHYDDPFLPDIPGIKEWIEAFPGSISHSKFYRRPDEYKSKKVLVVGNSASGTDIASQLSPYCLQPLLISSRSAPPKDFPLPHDDKGGAAFSSLPEIAAFNPIERSIRFVNGHAETDIDRILFCTGYLYSLPFLRTLEPPLIGDGTRVQNLCEQIFYAPKPTLSFLTLPQRIVPFPVAESQSAVVARYLSGRLSLPSSPSSTPSPPPIHSRFGNPTLIGKAYHVLGYPLDAEYINHLHDWAMSASPPRRHRHHHQGDQPPDDDNRNRSQGKEPPYWGEYDKWIRERVPLIKTKSRALGSARWKVRTLQELGFDFERWKAEADAKAKVEEQGVQAQ